MGRSRPTRAYPLYLRLMIPTGTLLLCIHAKKHFAWLQRAVDSDIPIMTLQFQAAISAKADTSTVRYPKRHDHCILSPTAPWATSYMQSLRGRMSKDGKAQIGYLFAIEHHPEQ